MFLQLISLLDDQVLHQILLTHMVLVTSQKNQYISVVYDDDVVDNDYYWMCEELYHYYD